MEARQPLNRCKRPVAWEVSNIANVALAHLETTALGTL
jgi:hypothetical protein